MCSFSECVNHLVWHLNSRQALIILLVSVVLLDSGCTQYVELSSPWQHQGFGSGGLVFYETEFSEAAHFQLNANTRVMVATASGLKLTCLDAQSKSAKSTAQKFTAQKLTAQKSSPQKSNSQMKQRASFKRDRLRRRVVLMQAQVLKSYFTQVQFTDDHLTLSQAFVEARRQGAGVLFFLYSDLWQEPSRHPCVDDAVPCSLNDHGGILSPFLMKEQLAFWVYDVQTEAVLQSGRLAVKTLTLRHNDATALRQMSHAMRAIAARLTGVKP